MLLLKLAVVKVGVCGWLYCMLRIISVAVSFIFLYGCAYASFQRASRLDKYMLFPGEADTSVQTSEVPERQGFSLDSVAATGNGHEKPFRTRGRDLATTV